MEKTITTSEKTIENKQVVTFLNRFQFGIVGKIMSGYLTIFLVSAVVMTFCLFSLNTNRNMDTQVSEVYSPSLLYLKDVGNFANETFNLTNNWIYQPSGKDKDRLKKLFSEDFTKLGTEVTTILDRIQNENERKTMDSS